MPAKKIPAEAKLTPEKSRTSTDIGAGTDTCRSSPVTAKVFSTKSKRGLEEGEEAGSDKVTKAKGEKKKRRHPDGDEETAGHIEAGERKKKKQRKTEAKSDETKSTVKETVESHKSKNLRKYDDDDTADRKRRKKERKKEKFQDDELIKEKKLKTKCAGLPDPREDTSLIDQARKALAYAYIQFDDPTSWKFNKARQNWLIRNTWSDEMIPELHMPLLIRYLTNIKGGVRDKLTATSRSIVSPISVVSTDPLLQTTTTSQAETVSSKHLRARMILDALSTEP